MATTLDPCQLVTSQEAASLAGVSYGPGRPATYGGAGGSSNGCTYGYQTLDVFMVLVSQAPDAGSANAMWAQEQAQSQAALATAAGTAGTSLNVNVNDVANITGATRVAVGTGTITRAGTTINISVIYMLKNAIFFTFSNLAVGHATPSLSAMEAQGTTVIGRLP